MSLWPFAVRGQGQLVASASTRDFERRVHQLVANSRTASAFIYHHVFDNRGWLQRACQVPVDENVIGAHDTPVLDRNQKDLVRSFRYCAQCAAHRGRAGTDVIVFVELPVEILNLAFVADARATNTNAGLPFFQNDFPIPILRDFTALPLTTDPPRASSGTSDTTRRRSPACRRRQSPPPAPCRTTSPSRPIRTRPARSTRRRTACSPR